MQRLCVEIRIRNRNGPVAGTVSLEEQSEWTESGFMNALGRRNFGMSLLKKENVQICDTADNWRDAIRISVRPLEQGGYVESCYKDGIIENIEKLGPYIIIADHIALPHARPEQGAVKTQIGITLFRQDIEFDGKEATARLFVTLAAKDNDSHLDALVQISELLSDEERVEKILESPDVQTLYHYFERI